MAELELFFPLHCAIYTYNITAATLTSSSITLSISALLGVGMFLLMIFHRLAVIVEDVTTIILA